MINIIGKAIVIAIALSVDSMAVSLSGSVSLGKLDWKKISCVALILALVQTLLLCAGYFAGEGISVFVSKYGPWIGFAVLLYVGGSMIYEALKEARCCRADGESAAEQGAEGPGAKGQATEGPGAEEQKDFGSAWKIIVAAIATSIDAMATGASFGLCGMEGIELSVIATFTFLATIVFAVLGMLCGYKIGCRFGRPAKIVAGIVLILIGLELLIA